MTDNEYITVSTASEQQITEKKSKFISNMAHIETEQQAIDFIKSIKKKYFDAHHNVYAYIVGGDKDARIKKYSDDGEPTRTGGFPVLEMLERENITDVVCVVTRYFGGILLGTGGLIRAYTLAAQTGLEASGKKKLEICDVLKITIGYNLLSNLEYILKDKAIIENKEFSSEVILTVYTTEQNCDIIVKNIIDSFNGNIKVEKISKEYKAFN